MGKRTRLFIFVLMLLLTTTATVLILCHLSASGGIRVRKISAISVLSVAKNRVNLALIRV
jgi:hypothetical protein